MSERSLSLALEGRILLVEDDAGNVTETELDSDSCLKIILKAIMDSIDKLEDQLNQEKVSTLVHELGVEKVLRGLHSFCKFSSNPRDSKVSEELEWIIEGLDCKDY